VVQKIVHGDDPPSLPSDPALGICSFYLLKKKMNMPFYPKVLMRMGAG